MDAMPTSRFRPSRRIFLAFCTDRRSLPAPAMGTTPAFAIRAAGTRLPAYRKARRLEFLALPYPRIRSYTCFISNAVTASLNSALFMNRAKISWF